MKIKNLYIIKATRTIPTIDTTTRQQITTADTSSFRLPNYITPINYKLDIRAFYSAITGTNDEGTSDRFNGTVKISFSLTEPSNRIVLNANQKYLTIMDSIVITRPNGVNINVRDGQHKYRDYQLYEITIDDVLPVGTYDISLDFTGRLAGSELTGFYKSSYLENSVYK